MCTNHFLKSSGKVIVSKLLLSCCSELDHNEFLLNLFQKEFAVIREGEVTIVELWYKFQAKKLAESRNTVLSEELMKEAITLYPPPNNIDFRIVGA